ncbi:MAG TPA: hypothetical protein VF597_00865 [Candidatus Saccharimonadales bacterium]|jgi:hypothetical protein
MKPSHLWRRFRPQRSHPAVHHDLVSQVRLRIGEVWHPDRHHDHNALFNQLHEAAAMQSRRAQSSHSAVDEFALLLLRAPAAVAAQRQMDRHEHGYRHREARLFELIDFNDTFVSTVLALTPEQRKDFLAVCRQELDRFCSELGVPTFTDEQYMAIVRGLSREIAVYIGAHQQGFDAQMTSRVQDSMGVDMTVTDPRTHRTVGIDCKTPSAYRHRLIELVEQGRLSDAAGAHADELGFIRLHNGHGSEAVDVTMVRIDEQELGEITAFAFADSTALGHLLARVLTDTLSRPKT